jgi:hypothetical protein
VNKWAVLVEAGGKVIAGKLHGGLDLAVHCVELLRYGMMHLGIWGTGYHAVSV